MARCVAIYVAVTALAQDDSFLQVLHAKAERLHRAVLLSERDASDALDSVSIFPASGLLTAISSKHMFHFSPCALSAVEYMVLNNPVCAMSDDDVLRVLRVSPRLESLRLNFPTIEVEDGDTPFALPTITYVLLQVDDDCRAHDLLRLMNFPHLETLILHGDVPSSKSRLQLLDAVADCCPITSLRISCIDTADWDLLVSSLVRLKHVRHVTIDETTILAGALRAFCAAL